MTIRKLQRGFAPSDEFLSLDGSIRSTLSKAIRHCADKTREDIARELSERTGTHITLRMLNELTAESRRPHRFPAAWVIPFCRITADDSLQRLLLGPDLAEALQIGEAEIEAHRARTAAVARRTAGVR